MKSPSDKQIAIDLGNSRAKMMTPDGSSFSVEYSHGWAESAAEFISAHSPLAAGISSVSYVRYEQLLAAISNSSIKKYDAAEMLADTRLICWKHIEGAGADRILGMIGANAIFPPPLITIDCGTAITINAMDGNIVFAGGAIMPGLATQAKALAGSAEQLKEIEIIPKRIIAGANTADAILAGILYGAAGAVTNICKRIERNIFGCQSRIILTGGHSGLLHFAIGQDMQTELRDNLVMRGILRLLDEREELSDN